MNSFPASYHISRPTQNIPGKKSAIPSTTPDCGALALDLTVIFFIAAKPAPALVEVIKNLPRPCGQRRLDLKLLLSKLNGESV